MAPNCEISLENGNTIKITRDCSVCSDPAETYFSGLFVCKNCLNRFRDAVEKKLQPDECEYDPPCDTTGYLGCVCENCHYRECLSAGMKKNELENLNRKRTAQFLSIGSSKKSCKSTPFLDKIQLLYQNYCSVRKERDNSDKNLSYTSYCEMIKGESQYFVDFFESCFPTDFEKMRFKDKVNLVSPCYFTFRVLECAHVTKEENRDDLFFFATGQYVDLKNLSRFLEIRDPILFKKDIENLRQVFEVFKRDLVQGATLSFLEFIAIGVLLMWSKESLIFWSNGSKCLLALIEKVRARVRNELLVHYENNGLDADSRMFDIHEYLHNVEKVQKKFCEVSRNSPFLSSTETFHEFFYQAFFYL